MLSPLEKSSDNSQSQSISENSNAMNLYHEFQIKQSLQIIHTKLSSSIQSPSYYSDLTIPELIKKIDLLVSEKNFRLKNVPQVTPLYPEKIKYSTSSHENNYPSKNLEKYLIFLEKQHKNSIQKILELQLQLDICNQAIQQYMIIQRDYEEMKQKYKYSKGKFLDNDRKENEILILRAENSNIKKENDKNLKKIIELEKKIEDLELKITNFNSTTDLSTIKLNNNSNLTNLSNINNINNYNYISNSNYNNNYNNYNNNTFVNIIKNKKTLNNERSNSVNSIFECKNSDIVSFRKFLPRTFKNSNSYINNNNSNNNSKNNSKSKINNNRNNNNNNNLSKDINNITGNFNLNNVELYHKKLNFDFNHSRIKFLACTNKSGDRNNQLFSNNSSSNFKKIKGNNNNNNSHSHSKKKLVNNIQYNYYSNTNRNDKFGYNDISHNFINSKDKIYNKLNNPKLILYRNRHINCIDNSNQVE